MSFASIAQGAYFILTGLWSLFSIGTFQIVTGRKTDLWLVKTVGVLVTAIGAVLTMAGVSGRFTPEIFLLPLGSASGLAAIDFYYVAKRTISRVYLLDAVLEIGLILWWAASWKAVKY